MPGKLIFPGFFPGSSFVEQTQSIAFDGVSEILASSSVLMGIANTWSIAFWTKIVDIDLNTNQLFNISPGNNEIQLFQRTTVGDAPSLQFLAKDSVGSDMQNVAWTALSLFSDTWHHIVLQWEGNANRKLYLDGVDQGAVGFSATDNDGTMADTNRIATVSPPANQAITGHSWAWWDILLTSGEVTAIYNGGNGAGFNLAADSGNYVSSASLQHWFRLGHLPSPDLGKDEGIASVLLNLEDGAVGIDDTDRVADVPT